MKKIIALLLLCSSFFNCERDDICPESTATTPKLIIRFYDIANQMQTKSVTNLLVHGIGNDEAFLASTDSIAIPLKTDGVTTGFELYKEYEEDVDGNIIGGNMDILTFTYNPKEIYVSRACGYKSIFENVEDDLENDGDNWIKLILIEDPLTIDNETAAHVQIFH